MDTPLMPPGTKVPQQPEHHLAIVADLVAFLDHWAYAQATSPSSEVPAEALHGLARVCHVMASHLDAVRRLL